MLKEIIYKNRLYALIIKETYQNKKGISFFTKNSANQQIGFMNHPKNYTIKPHKHRARETKIVITSEVIILQRGRLRVDFYDNKLKYLFSIVLKKNQIIMLVHGGHGFKALEPIKMLEIKQGPFIGSKDKKKFDEVNEKKIKIRKF